MAIDFRGGGEELERGPFLGPLKERLKKRFSGVNISYEKDGVRGLAELKKVFGEEVEKIQF